MVQIAHVLNQRRIKLPLILAKEEKEMIKYTENSNGVITIEYANIPYGEHLKSLFDILKTEVAKAKLIGIKLPKDKYYVLKNRFENPKKISKKEWKKLVSYVEKGM